MRAKATFAGEPVHPMFVHYPIALWTTSVITALIFYFSRNTSLILISKFLIAAGIVGAILAEIFRLVGWTGVTDRVSKKNANLQLILIGSAIVLLGASRAC